MIFRNKTTVNRYQAELDEILARYDAEIEVIIARGQARADALIADAQREANHVIQQARIILEAAKQQVAEAEKVKQT